MSGLVELSNKPFDQFMTKIKCVDVTKRLLFLLMVNPIQSVLAAEQSAQDQIETARNEAEEILKGARQRARSIVERSENRTQRAVANYEKQRTRAVTGEIHRMRKKRRQTLHHHVTKLEDELDGIFGDIVAQFWPAPPDGGAG